MDVWCGLYLYFLSMQKASLCEYTCEGNKYTVFTWVCLSSASVPRFLFTEIYLNICATLVQKHFLTLTSIIIFQNPKSFTCNGKQNFLHNSNQVGRVSKSPAVKSVCYLRLYCKYQNIVIGYQCQDIDWSLQALFKRKPKQKGILYLHLCILPCRHSYRTVVLPE